MKNSPSIIMSCVMCQQRPPNNEKGNKFRNWFLSFGTWLQSLFILEWNHLHFTQLLERIKCVSIFHCCYFLSFHMLALQRRKEKKMKMCVIIFLKQPFKFIFQTLVQKNFFFWVSEFYFSGNDACYAVRNWECMDIRLSLNACQSVLRHFVSLWVRSTLIMQEKQIGNFLFYIQKIFGVRKTFLWSNFCFIFEE